MKPQTSRSAKAKTSTIAEVTQAKNRVSKELRKLPGVVGVGVSSKAVQVYLEKEDASVRAAVARVMNRLASHVPFRILVSGMPIATAPALRESSTASARPPITLNLRNITNRQLVEVRPGEPVYLFNELIPGYGRWLDGVNRRSPFQVKQLTGSPPGINSPPNPGPLGVTNTRPGVWYEVSLSPRAKPGQRDGVHVVAWPLLNPDSAKPEITTRFTLVARARRP